MQQQQWTQATEDLEKIEQPEQMTSEFLDRWRFNRAMALVGEAGADGSLDDDDRRTLLETALKITQGNDHPTMRSLRTAVKQSLTRLQFTEDKKFLTKESPLQGLGILWAWATDLRHQLDLVPNSSPATDVKDFLAFYADKGRELGSFGIGPQSISELLNRVVDQLSYRSIASVQTPLNGLISALESSLKKGDTLPQKIQQTLVMSLAVRPVNLDAVKKLQGQLEQNPSPYLALEQSRANAAFAAQNDVLKAIFAQQTLYWLQEFLAGDQTTSAKETLSALFAWRTVRGSLLDWHLNGLNCKRVCIPRNSKFSLQ